MTKPKTEHKRRGRKSALGDDATARALIIDALKKYGTNVGAAAALGVSEFCIRHNRKRLGIKPTWK